MTEPLIALDADEFGGGTVMVSPEFAENLSSLERADLLQDYIAELEDMYESVLNNNFLADLGATGMNNPPASSSVN